MLVSFSVAVRITAKSDIDLWGKEEKKCFYETVRNWDRCVGNKIKWKTTSVVQTQQGEPSRWRLLGEET